MISARNMINDAVARTGITLKELAAKSGIHPESINKYSSGVITNPTINSLEKLAAACDLVLEARPKDVPRCPCERCKRIYMGCELCCIPFTDWKRSLIKRRTAWKG